VQTWLAVTQNQPLQPTLYFVEVEGEFIGLHHRKISIQNPERRAITVQIPRLEVRLTPHSQDGNPRQLVCFLPFIEDIHLVVGNVEGSDVLKSLIAVLELKVLDHPGLFPSKWSTECRKLYYDEVPAKGVEIYVLTVLVDPGEVLQHIARTIYRFAVNFSGRSRRYGGSVAPTDVIVPIVGVAVDPVGIGLGLNLCPIIKAVIITIRVFRIGSQTFFFDICQTIAVCVGLARKEGKQRNEPHRLELPPQPSENHMERTP
jgi:hypothetical protein